ncbi:MAG: DUF645 family protein [Bacteroidales bacterium]|nr:DUF645 family protein [Bacteroidales bacterium]
MFCNKKSCVIYVIFLNLSIILPKRQIQFDFFAEYIIILYF